MDLLSLGAYGKHFRAKYADQIAKGEGPAINRERRMVTPASVGFDAPGSFFERATNAANMTAAEKGTFPTANVEGYLKDISEAVRQAVSQINAPQIR
jgi:hypothetical protein